MSLWKRVGCQTESKALEKSIVERIVQDCGQSLLNPEMQSPGEIEDVEEKMHARASKMLGME